MGGLTAKQVTEIVSKVLQPLIVDLASVRGGIQELKGGQVSQELRSRRLERKVSEMDDKIGALIVDVHNLQQDVRGLWDVTTETQHKQDRKFKEIKEELGLAS